MKPPVPDETLEERFPPPRRVTWQIPPNVKIILSVWALALFIFVGLFSLWQWRDQHEAKERDIEQDRALCEVIVFSLQAPPTIPPGPEGDRIREGLAKAERLRKVTCE